MRILHAPNNIANQAWSTAQGLRALGHEVDVWHYGPNTYDFPADRVIDIDNDPERSFAAFRDAVDRDFEVFHFHFARSLISPVRGLPWFWDLPVLRALGKVIVFTFHGSDVRKKSVHLAEDPWSYFRFSDVNCDEDRIDKALAVIRTYAHTLVVASPLSRTFVPEAEYVPKAIEIERFPYVGARRERRPLVVHSPSSRATKGTEFVIAGMERLRERGIEFDFRLAENLKHAEHRALYEDADIVVDNLLLGDCEVSALEAMALGKPVVTRIRDEVLLRHPDMPAISADPETFVDALEGLVRDGRFRRRVGEQSRSFVESNHAAALVAKKLELLYQTPGRTVTRVFPDWTGVANDRKLEKYERRLLELETKVRVLRQRLNDKTKILDDLRRLYGGSRPFKIIRAARRRRKNLTS